MATSTFQRWVTEGQLLTIVFGVVFFTWLGMTIWLDPVDRPGEMNTVLLAVMGAWITNITYGFKERASREKAEEKKKADEDFERRIEEAFKKRQTND